MEKYIVGVVLMDKNGKIYRWCYFDVKILTTFCIDFVLMIQNVRGKNCIGVGVWPWDLIAIQWLRLSRLHSRATRFDSEKLKPLKSLYPKL